MSLTTFSAVGGFLSLLGIAVLVAWLAFSCARWLGGREAHRHEREQEGPVGSVVGATLALLAFTLAITFNMAHAKYSNRKDLVREDVRTIESAFDRAMLLPAGETRVAHQRLAEYAKMRAFDPFGAADPPITEIVSRSKEIQRALWRQALAYHELPQVRFYMDSLSAMTSVHAERVTMGMHDRVPLPVWLCLAFVTALAMVMMGYQSALAGSKRAWTTIPLILAFCTVLCIAIDLDHPQQGVLRIDQGPMMRLATTLRHRVDE